MMENHWIVDTKFWDVHIQQGLTARWGVSPGHNSASASFPPWSHMSNVWRQSPDPWRNFIALMWSLATGKSGAPLNFSRFPPGQMRHSAVPQRIRSGCVSLTDFKTAVGMQRGRVNIPKRCSAIEKSANLPKRRFVMEQMCFQHAQKDVSRQELCRQHAKTCFAIEKRAVNIPKHTKTTFGHRKKQTCPQDATSN